MGTKSQNGMVSIRHEQGALTAVDADNTNSVVVKSAVKTEVVLKLKIQEGILGADNTVTKTGINTVVVENLLGTGFVFLGPFCCFSEHNNNLMLDSLAAVLRTEVDSRRLH